MMSPKVAVEVGNKMGSVEDVEHQRRTDDQKLFLRVRVALHGMAHGFIDLDKALVHVISLTIVS